MIFSAPAPIERGDIFGQLKALEKLKNGKWRCGCACGFSNVLARQNALRQGRIARCKECREQRTCKSEHGPTKETT